MSNGKEKSRILGIEVLEEELKISFLNETGDEMITNNWNLYEGWEPQQIHLILKEFLAEKEGPFKMIFAGEESLSERIRQTRLLLINQGYKKEDLKIISKENAFIHYVLHQEEEIRRHTVFLFDFDGRELSCYRLSHFRKKQPEQYKAEKKILGSFLGKGEKENNGRMDEGFAKAAQQILSKEVVSAVYLNGKGFDGNWLDHSLRVLCDGRRAFLGRNLFSLGCCYYGKSLDDGDLSSVMIQAPETVLYEVGILDGGQNDRFVPIVESGCAWYDAKGGIDIIPERGGKIDVIFINSLNQEKQIESVDISDLENRPRKTGRLHLRVEFFSNHTGALFVRDKGFGAFYPATNQVFFHKFTLL